MFTSADFIAVPLSILASLYKWAVVFFHVKELVGSQILKCKKSAKTSWTELPDLKFVKKFTRPNFQAKEFYTLKTRKS